MLFNSYPFLLIFLPITLLGAVLLNRWAARPVSLAWLVGMSLVFYGWSDPSLVVLMGGSILGNYFCGRCLIHQKQLGHFGRKTMLTLGIVGNLAFIGYYKYAGFALQNLAVFFPADWSLPQIALPLGISFYTFQQIAYLVDAYRGEVRDHCLLDYSLFVVFFPQLIAGPIVHHRDMLDQFRRPTRFPLSWDNFSIGMTIFTIGMAKKVLLADGFAPFATALFTAAEQGRSLSLLEAWIGTLCYTFQLYFDFSGYSDMAIGLARLFAIRLPINFDSPYKATDIIDFWRRWHITLSQFLRDYLYIPFGGNRCGKFRRHGNLLLTMLLGGLWHGAGWTFVLWGGLHGLMLIGNHAIRSVLKTIGISWPEHWTTRCLARVVTLVCVSATWVLFRANSLTGAGRMYSGLMGLGTSAWFNVENLTRLRQNPTTAAIWVVMGLLIVWGLPNSQELMGRVRPALRYRYRITPMRAFDYLTSWLQWRPHPAVAIWYATLFVFTFCSLAELSEFIYFHF